MNAEHIHSRIASIDGEIEEKQKQRESYDKEREQISEEAKAALEKQSLAEADLEAAQKLIEELDGSIEADKNQIISLLNEKAGLSGKQQRYMTMLEQVQVRRSEVCQKLLKYKSEESVQEEQLEEQKKILEQLEAELTDLENKQAESEARLEELEAEGKVLNRRLNDVQQLSLIHI